MGKTSTRWEVLHVRLEPEIARRVRGVMDFLNLRSLAETIRLMANITAWVIERLRRGETIAAVRLDDEGREVIERFVVAELEGRSWQRDTERDQELVHS